MISTEYIQDGRQGRRAELAFELNDVYLCVIPLIYMIMTQGIHF